MRGTISFDNVSKRYYLGQTVTLRGAFANLRDRLRGKARSEEFWALQGVSFNVKPGEAIGLIGPNGAGKTTTLKLLSGITRSTSGNISIKGRISSLIELGAGFHPELSGRENIFLNGAILGLSRREIHRKLDSIVEFSGIEKFIDTPVKRYSSGMYVRLGFAVAAHVEPDILLVDEVLSVGDSSFRQKCMKRMELLRKNGTTLVFVSHNMHQVRRVCQKAVLLDGGEAVFYGSVADTIAAYEETLQIQAERNMESKQKTNGTANLVVTRVELRDENGKVTLRLRSEQKLDVRIQYKTTKPILEPIVKLRILNAEGIVCAMGASHHRSNYAWTFAQQGELAVIFDPVQVTTGRYSIEVRVADGSDTVLLASNLSDEFFVNGPSLPHEPDKGIFVPNLTWEHK